MGGKQSTPTTGSVRHPWEIIREDRCYVVNFGGEVHYIREGDATTTNG